MVNKKLFIAFNYIVSNSKLTSVDKESIAVQNVKMTDAIHTYIVLKQYRLFTIYSESNKHHYNQAASQQLSDVVASSFFAQHEACSSKIVVIITIILFVSLSCTKHVDLKLKLYLCLMVENCNRPIIIIIGLIFVWLSSTKPVGLKLKLYLCLTVLQSITELKNYGLLYL